MNVIFNGKVHLHGVADLGLMACGKRVNYQAEVTNQPITCDKCKTIISEVHWREWNTKTVHMLDNKDGEHTLCGKGEGNMVDVCSPVTCKTCLEKISVKS